MQSKQSKYIYPFLFCSYILMSVASQFLTGMPITFGHLNGLELWLPLSAFTLVPMVDVLRSLTQDAAEKEGKTFKHVLSRMTGITLIISGVCVVLAGLPLPIFVGVLLAVTFGGIVDIGVFRLMRRVSSNPAIRMTVSNLGATLVGSGIVFFVAFSDLFFSGYPFTKAMPDVITGWLFQSLVIWISGTIISHLIQFLRGKYGQTRADA